MLITQTDRLTLRELEPADAGFIHALLNDADFLANVGDRGVRTLEDATAFIDSGPRASYAQHGFGLWAVALRDGGLASIRVLEKLGMVRERLVRLVDDGPELIVFADRLAPSGQD